MVLEVKLSYPSCFSATPTPYPWTKFVVPSTGSMIHVGLSVRMHDCPFATDSSPMKLQEKQKLKLPTCGNQHTVGASCKCVALRASHQCACSPNFPLIDPMMIFSTVSSVCVTRSTAELFASGFISFPSAFLITCTN